MISIKQRQEKFRLGIENEEWEYESLKIMKEDLNKILEMKKAHGQLKEGKKELW